MSDILGLGQVALAAKDVASLTNFYRDKVGLNFLFSAGPNLSFFDLHGARLMIDAPEGGGTVTANSVFYYKVTSVDDYFGAKKGELNFIDEPHLIAQMPDHELWMVFFKDPEGNIVGLMEERRPK